MKYLVLAPNALENPVLALHILKILFQALVKRMLELAPALPSCAKE